MPLFAKILALLNVLAAGGFIYLATLDYEMRQLWSYEVFRHELYLDGLPVDERDVGRRVDRAVFPDVDQASYEIFQLAGAGESVRTQKEEVENLRDKIKGDLTKLNPAARREKLKSLYLVQTGNVAEREAIRDRFGDLKKNTTEKLTKEFLDRFDQLAAEAAGDTSEQKQYVVRRKADIAHLLYNLRPRLLDHQRLMVVIGLRAYVREAEIQAIALRDMAHRLHLMTIDDREHFALAYQQQRERNLYLAYETLRKRQELKDSAQLVTNTKNQIDERKKEIEDLTLVVAKAIEDTEAALKKQNDLEQQLFQQHQKLGDLIEQNRKLEHEIRNLELGRTRGGRS